MVKISVQNDAGDIELLDHPRIVPVELAEELWNAGIDAFKAAMLGRMTSKDVERYWENCSDMDWFKRHPHRPEVEHWNSTLPVWVHGDAARAFKCQKILILSWMCGLMSGCSWNSRLLYSVIPADELSQLTLQSLLAAFANDINELQRCLKLPWRFLYVASKGDLEWHAMAYRLQRYYRCSLLCFKCFASQTEADLLYTNLLDDAGWTCTDVQTSHLLEEFADAPEGAPSLCSIEGWSAEMMFWDLMHILFIGLGRLICGSSMVLLCVTGFYSRSNCTDSHLLGMHGRFRDWRLRHNVAVYVEKFTHKLIGCPNEIDKCDRYANFPELDVKAAHVKCIIMFLADELGKAGLLPNQEVKDAGACLHFLASFVWTLEHADLWLTQSEADAQYSYGMKFLLILRHLARLGRHHNLSRWNIIPKFHYFHHCIRFMWETKMNMMKATCFLDEDFMGKVKKLASKTHRTTVSLRTLQRYLVLLGLRWKRVRKHRGLSFENCRRVRARHH